MPRDPKGREAIARLGALLHLGVVLSDLQDQVTAKTGIGPVVGRTWAYNTADEGKLASALDEVLASHFARAEVLATLKEWSKRTKDMRRDRKLESFVDLALDLVDGRGSRMQPGKKMTVGEAVQIARRWGSSAREVAVQTELDRKRNSSLSKKLATLAYALAEGTPQGRRWKTGQSEVGKAYDGEPRGPMAAAITAVLVQQGVTHRLSEGKKLGADIPRSGNVSQRPTRSGGDIGNRKTAEAEKGRNSARKPAKDRSAKAT